MFWQIGHDDGMEFNIASRQTRDILRGAPSYRPSFNAYMWADAQAIARIADLAGDKANADKFRAKADALKARVQSMLWDPKREFFLIRFKNNESNEKDFPGKPIKAGTLIYEDGPFAGSPEGRELIGYVPWQFNLPDPGYRVGLEVPHGHELLLRAVRAQLRRAQRPDVPAQEIVLLVERPVLALRHHADAQGAGQPAAELPAGRHHPRRLLPAAAHLRADPSQGRQALHRRGGPSGHRLVGKATTATTTASTISTAASTT